MSFRILTLNQISPRGLARLPADRYQVGADIAAPDAILVRSAELHGAAIAASVRAIGRAGVGVNNIPVDDMSRRGVPVFNTPGANANAVKELVLAGLLLAARNIGPAWLFARGLSGDDAAIEAAVEAGKRRFVGFELPGRTLGVVGLGAVGVEVANSALALGMKVLGYDPQLTVQRAWQLSSSAAITAVSSTMAARAKLRIVPSFFISASRALFTRLRVCSLSGTCTLIASERANRSSSDSACSTLADSCQARCTVSCGS